MIKAHRLSKTDQIKCRIGLWYHRKYSNIPLYSNCKFTMIQKLVSKMMTTVVLLESIKHLLFAINLFSYSLLSKL